MNNLTETADEELLKLELGYLVMMMIFFKHFRDKNYIIEKTGEIFSYAQSYSEVDGILTTQIRRAFFYLTSSSDLEKEDVDQVVKNISKKINSTLMTAYEEIKLEGKEEVIINLIRKLPHMNDKEIANLADVPRKMVKEIRSKISKN